MSRTKAKNTTINELDHILRDTCLSVPSPAKQAWISPVGEQSGSLSEGWKSTCIVRHTLYVYVAVYAPELMACFSQSIYLNSKGLNVSILGHLWTIYI